jgi:hypothetical protein
VGVTADLAVDRCVQLPHAYRTATSAFASPGRVTQARRHDDEAGPAGVARAANDLELSALRGDALSEAIVVEEFQFSGRRSEWAG